MTQRLYAKNKNKTKNQMLNQFQHDEMSICFALFLGAFRKRSFLVQEYRSL